MPQTYSFDLSAAFGLVNHPPPLILQPADPSAGFFFLLVDPVGAYHFGVPLSEDERMRVPSYLHRNRHGVYGFRAVIPKRFRVAFTQHETRLTLGTFRICDAKRLARLLSAVLLAHLAGLPQMSSDDATAQGRLLLEDLARARDQFTKQLLSLAEDPRVQTGVEN